MPHGPVPHGLVPHAAVPAAAAALVAAQDALRGTPFSREALRAAVVRYGTVCADAGALASELTGALDAALGPTLARFPDPVAAELRVHVAWWAAHGYYRAD
ncbi:MAG TPA: hypothetical protein VGD56_03960 [Gemmatirosa sp.]